jgi:hypothetical protein
MTKCIVLFAAGLSVSVLLFASDFWEKKKFGDWSGKEVQKMLKDSPWSQSVELGLPGGAGPNPGRGGRGGRGGGLGVNSASASDASGGGAAGAGPDSVGEIGEPGGRGGMGAPAGVTAIIRWQSALPIRQAMAKMKFGSEAAASPDAARILARSEHYYIVSVTGIPQQIRAAQGSLKIAGKDAIQSVDVKASPDGGTRVLYFIFPRDPIALEDKEVEFATKVGSFDLKRRFRLKDMVFEGNLEL